MTTTGSSAAKPGQDHEHEHDRELVRAIADALVLAVGKRAAHQALRHARGQHHRAALDRIMGGRAIQAAAHLAGYGALIGYIWRHRRTSPPAAA
jgi:hypothetical protein